MFDKTAGWKDLALPALIGAGGGGLAGAGYGALADQDNIGLRALEGAGIGGLGGLGVGAGKLLGLKAEERALSNAMKGQMAPTSVQNEFGQNLGKRLRMVGQRTADPDEAAKAILQATGSKGTKKWQAAGGAAGAAAGAGGVAAAEKSRKKKAADAAYEAGMKYAFAMYGLDKLAAYL